MRFGKDIGKGKVAGRTGGYQSLPLSTDDFCIELLDDAGRARRAKNKSESKALDAVRRKISIGLRGSSADRFHITPEGMILFGAVPHKEKVPKAWQGPSPNVKLEMQRVFPRAGDFVMRVHASRGYIPPMRRELLVPVDEAMPFTKIREDGSVRAHASSIVMPASAVVSLKNLARSGELLVPKNVPKDSHARFAFQVEREGFYQVDLVHPVVETDQMPQVRLHIAGQNFDVRTEVAAGDEIGGRKVTTICAAGLRKGVHNLRVGGKFFVGFSHVVVTPLPDTHPLVRRLSADTEKLARANAGKTPWIRAFVGTRTDDGMDYKTFGSPQRVDAPLGEARVYEFFGRLEDLPIPEPESGDTEILSGFMLLGLWNDHLVKKRGEIGPPLLVEAIEFEAPFHPQWPPESQRAIFLDSPWRNDLEVYTREWGLEALFGARSPAERAVIDDAFRTIVDAIESMPFGFVHRDYQSKNLMVSESDDLTLIDYQDAMIGPRVYDLVALLCDSYVSLDPELQRAMIDRYAALRRIDRDELQNEFRWVTLHRKLKDAGRFVFIDRVRGNPDFLEWFPQSLVYVGRAVSETPVLARFGELLTTAIPGFPDAVEKPTSTLT